MRKIISLDTGNDNSGKVDIFIPDNDITEDIEIRFPNKESVLLTLKKLQDASIVSSDIISKPTFTSPLNNSEDFNGKFIFTPYETSDNYEGECTETIIEISNDADFTDMYGTYIVAGEVNEMIVSIDGSEQIYYARVRYNSGDHVGDASEVSRFITDVAYTHPPTIVAPADGSETVKELYIELGEYYYVNDLNTLKSVRYQIATDVNFTDLKYDQTSTVDLENHVIPDNILDGSTTYYVRAKYTGDLYGETPWGGSVSFTTISSEILAKLENYGYLHSVIQDTDGNYVAVGRCNDNTDAYIVKLDSNLNLMTDKMITSAGVADGLESVIQDSDGNYVAVGVCNNTGAGKWYSYVVKFDSNLNIIIDKRISGGNSYDQLQSVTQDSDGNYIIVGYCKGYHSGSTVNYDAYIAKLDIDFNIIGDRKIIGSSFRDSLDSVIQDTDGNYVAVGFCNHTGSALDAYIVKLDTNLNLITDKMITSGTRDHLLSVIQDSDGNYVAVGYCNFNGSAYDAYIVKLDTNLNLITDKMITSSSAYDYLHSVIQDSDGNYVTVGWCNNNNGSTHDAYIVKLDTNLNLITDKMITSSSVYDLLNSVIQDTDGNYIAVGLCNNNGSGGNQFIVKFNSDLTTIDNSLPNSGMTISEQSSTVSEQASTVNEVNMTVNEVNATISEQAMTISDIEITVSKDIL